MANSWWGIQGGLEVELTWLYLAKAPEWEARLPAEVRARLANPNDAELKGFPHFPTTDLFLTATQARAGSADLSHIQSRFLFSIAQCVFTGKAQAQCSLPLIALSRADPRPRTPPPPFGPSAGEPVE